MVFAGGDNGFGLGGWYNTGRYIWGGVTTDLISLDAIRVSVS